MYLIAHRGASLERQENTVESLELGSRLGAYAVECDVRPTSDGVLVIYHDNEVGGKPVSEMTEAELRATLASRGKTLLTLDGLLDGYRGRALVLLHIKFEPDEGFFARLASSPVGFICGVETLESARRARTQFPPERILAFMPEKGMHREFFAAGAGIIRLWENWLDEIPPDAVKSDCPGARVFVMSLDSAGTMNGNRAANERFESLHADGVLLNDIRAAATDAIIARGHVTYEDFGAFGDAEHDDAEAIRDAHEFANAHGLPVYARPDGEYYIGGRDMTAYIETPTDWNTAHFTIDDTEVENNKSECFVVRSRLAPYELDIKTLRRDQKSLGFTLPCDSLVVVKNESVRRFIRFGPNQNNGSAQTDCFVALADGTITTPIDWDYDGIDSAVAYPVESDTLTVSGGTFTTLANRGPSVYDYYARGISVRRSNTVVERMTHYVAREIGHGSPYAGFLSAEKCADVAFRDCFFTGHKTYYTIGSAGVNVSMGSYDIGAGSVVNFTLTRCRVNRIDDRCRWGIIGSNFCKNILVESCVLSRLDAHQGVSGTYTIRDSSIGHMGVNAIGRGELLIENVDTIGRSVVNLRDDYGSTWEGTITLKNVRWTPANGDAASEARVIECLNNGMHGFGYECFMPREVKIDGLYIDDRNCSGQPALFDDPDRLSGEVQLPITEPRPFPYVNCARADVKNVSTASGRELRINLRGE